jgi:hypothetical protein
LTSEQKKQNEDRNASFERIRLEELMRVTRPAHATFAAAVLLQLQRSLFPQHAVALSPLPDDKGARALAAAAAAFEDMKMYTPYGAFPEDGRTRELKFWRETDVVLERRAAEEESRQFGKSFPNLAPNDDCDSGNSKSKQQPEILSGNHNVLFRSGQQVSSFKHENAWKARTLVPQVPPHLQLSPLESKLPDATYAPAAAISFNSSMSSLHNGSPKPSPGQNTRTYVAAAPKDSDAPEARDLPVPWFWLHPIASTDVRVLDIFIASMQEEDGSLLKQLMQQRQWLPAARLMRASLSQFLLDGPNVAPTANESASSSRILDDDGGGLNAALALLVFMITAAHSLIALAAGAEAQSQALLLKLPPPPPPPASFASKLMSDSATVLGMARALLSSHPLDSCRLHPKLQCWLGAVEACHFYHEQRSAAAAEALVQALVWESKYKANGIKASTLRVDEEKGIDPVSAEIRSSSLYLRCSINLQLSSVCLRCGDVNQSEQLALQALDSVSLFDAKKRDEHWSVMGATAELLLARLCAVADERAMEAQQWLRKASRSADKVSGPGRKSATRKPEALLVPLPYI